MRRQGLRREFRPRDLGPVQRRQVRRLVRRFDVHSLDNAWKPRASLKYEICDAPPTVAAGGQFRRDARRGCAAYHSASPSGRCSCVTVQRIYGAIRTAYFDSTLPRMPSQASSLSIQAASEASFYGSANTSSITAQARTLRSPCS